MNAHSFIHERFFINIYDRTMRSSARCDDCNEKCLNKIGIVNETPTFAEVNTELIWCNIDAAQNIVKRIFSR